MTRQLIKSKVQFEDRRRKPQLPAGVGFLGMDTLTEEGHGLVKARPLEVVRNLLFRERMVRRSVSESLAIKGPLGLMATYMTYFGAFVDPASLVAYRRGGPESFRGELRIERSEGRISIVPQIPDLNVGEDMLLKQAARGNAVCYLVKGGGPLYSLERGGRIVKEEAPVAASMSRMVVPFSGMRGVIDVLGNDLRLGGIINPQSAVVRSASVVADLISMRILSDTDPITGLLNRRAFEEAVGNAVLGFNNIGVNATLLLFNIDGFKDLNDIYGHDAGDIVLFKTADRMVRTFRATDAVARREKVVDGAVTADRLGHGEEVAVLLYDTDTADAVSVALRCKNAMEEIPIDVPGAEQVQVTVSVGAASLEDARFMIEDGGIPSDDSFLLATSILDPQRESRIMEEIAFMALESAKASGKNRIGSPVIEQTTEGQVFRFKVTE